MDGVASLLGWGCGQCRRFVLANGRRRSCMHQRSRVRSLWRARVATLGCKARAARARSLEQARPRAFCRARARDPRRGRRRTRAKGKRRNSFRSLWRAQTPGQASPQNVFGMAMRMAMFRRPCTVRNTLSSQVFASAAMCNSGPRCMRRVPCRRASRGLPAESANVMAYGVSVVPRALST